MWGKRPRYLPPWREHLQDTFWFAPIAGLVLVLILWRLVDLVDVALVEVLQDGGRDDAALLADLMRAAGEIRTVVTTVSSAMMAFIGVVFSISLVAVQLAAGQLSPRVVRLFVRSRIAKATFAAFLATFALSLLVLTSYEGETDPHKVGDVPIVQSFLTLVMVGLSLVLFVLYVNATLCMMRVGHVIGRITAEALRVIDRLPPDGAGPPARPDPAEETVLHRAGRAGILRDIHVARLVRLARRRRARLRLLPRVGDFVLPGTPLFAVRGGRPVRGRTLRRCVSIGVERSFRQDVAFGMRMLVDIALRASFPAVNDPTTAVQALDRIVQLLAAAGRRRLGELGHPDRSGTVRLRRPIPDWPELVDLAFAEIRTSATGSPQVTRRLLAGLDDLLAALPAGRHAPLLRQRRLLADGVARAVPGSEERAFALHPDRQGIGGPVSG